MYLSSRVISDLVLVCDEGKEGEKDDPGIDGNNGSEGWPLLRRIVAGSKIGLRIRTQVGDSAAECRTRALP